MSARNPHENPQPGDVILADNGRMRKVTRRDGNDIYYVSVEGGKEHMCWITTWSDWCRRFAFEPPQDQTADTARAAQQ